MHMSCIGRSGWSVWPSRADRLCDLILHEYKFVSRRPIPPPSFSLSLFLSLSVSLPPKTFSGRGQFSAHPGQTELQFGRISLPARKSPSSPRSRRPLSRLRLVFPRRDAVVPDDSLPPGPPPSFSRLYSLEGKITG